MTKKTKEVEAPAHAKFAPSSAHRWLMCHGSIYMDRTCPPLPESDFAAEGTLAHEIAAAILTDWLIKDSDILVAFDKYRSKFPNTEMEEHILDYCLTIARFVMTKKAVRIGVEKKFYLSEELGIWGTADFAITYPSQSGKPRGAIFDLKYGQGKVVEVDDNPQLACYAASMANDPVWGPLDGVDVYIFQPRAEHADGPLRKMSVPRNALELWKEEFVKAATETEAEIKAEKVTFRPGKHCQWCRGEGACKARLSHLNGEAGVDFTELDEVLPSIAVADEEKLPAHYIPPVLANMLTEDKVARLVLRRAEIESLLKRVEEFAIAQLRDGKTINGLKLVHGRAPRKWIAEEALVAARLRELGVADPYNKKLIGITEAEKVVGQGKLEDVTMKPEPSLKVVSVDDKRPAVETASQTAHNDFAEVTHEENNKKGKGPSQPRLPGVGEVKRAAKSMAVLEEDAAVKRGRTKRPVIQGAGGFSVDD